MARNRNSRSLLIVAMVVASITLLPCCRRAPEGPATETVGADQIEFDALDLPLENPQIAISLLETAPGLVATYNGEASIELTDKNRPNLRFTFDADFPQAPSRSPKTVEEFDRFIGKHNDGRLTDNGTIETALGAATWASGTYFEEDQSFGDVRVFVPHPSGAGTLILSAVCPAEEATVEDRLATMKEILTHIS